MDLGLLYRALQEKEVDVAVGSNTDAQIEAMHLVVLRDDRHYFPPYDAVPIIRQELINRDPRIGPALAALAGVVNIEDMRRMNYQVDVQHEDVSAVVASVLERVGRIK